MTIMGTIMGTIMAIIMGTITVPLRRAGVHAWCCAPWSRSCC